MKKLVNDDSFVMFLKHLRVTNSDKEQRAVVAVKKSKKEMRGLMNAFVKQTRGSNSHVDENSRVKEGVVRESRSKESAEDNTHDLKK